jgi:hypothetical protein
MSEKVTHVGTVSQLVEKKAGWFQVQISVPGKQYPVKADTKLEHLIAKAREVRDSGAVATFTIEEWDSENINPNSGQPYKERRLSGIEDGAQAPASGSSQPQAQPIEPKHEPVHDADRQRLITRQTCLKVAATVFQGVMVNAREGYDVGVEVMRLASRFERWLYRDIDEPPSSSGPEAAPVTPRSEEEVDAEVERLAAEYGQGNIPTDDIPY